MTTHAASSQFSTAVCSELRTTRSDLVNLQGDPAIVEAAELSSPKPFAAHALLESKALPLSWILDPTKKRLDRTVELQADKPESIYARILSRMVQQQAHEENPHLKDDRQIAWLTVHYCETGEAVLCAPFVLATYGVLGIHPDQVWPKIIQRRNALLGPPIGCRKKSAAQESRFEAQRKALREPAGVEDSPNPHHPAPVTLFKKTEAA